MFQTAYSRGPYAQFLAILGQKLYEIGYSQFLAGAI
jgi:hypothetical protein